MSETTIQPDWAKNTERLLEEIDKGMKIISSKELPQWAKDNEERSYAWAKAKYTAEAELYKEAAERGYLVVDTVVNLPFTESAGLYLGKFFATLRDEGKILANRCPQCQRIIFPPGIMCGLCRVRVEDKDENWVMLSDKGTILVTVNVTEREVDKATGKIQGECYPYANILLDGGDEWTTLGHYLKESDPEKLRTGMRVQAVWKPKEARRGRMTDISHFRVIEE